MNIYKFKMILLVFSPTCTVLLVFSPTCTVLVFSPTCTVLLVFSPTCTVLVFSPTCTVQLNVDKNFKLQLCHFALTVLLYMYIPMRKLPTWYMYIKEIILTMMARTQVPIPRNLL